MRRTLFAMTFFAAGLAAGTVATLPQAISQPAPIVAPAPLTFPPERGDALVLILDVIDGDTVDYANLVKVRARLDGINAPEVEGPQKKLGLASKANLQAIAPRTPIRAKLNGKEKYGRTLVDFIRDDGKSLSQLQIDQGFAVKWDGRGPRP